MDCSLPGSFVHGICQARILEWVTISFSKGSSNLHLLYWQADSLPLSHQEVHHTKYRLTIASFILHPVDEALA